MKRRSETNRWSASLNQPPPLEMFQPTEILLGFPFYNLIEDCTCLYEYKSEPRCYPIARYNTGPFSNSKYTPERAGQHIS